MLYDGKILMGRGTADGVILPNMANRHGLIAGATGTGKTITLKVMAESFSELGVPVFLADVKGDLAGCVKAGDFDTIAKRIGNLGIKEEDFPMKSFPVRFWDVFGAGGHPVRATVSDMGSTLISRLLGLTEAQTGVMAIVFRLADDKGWLLTDLKDLRSMVAYATEHSDEILNEYGNISKQSAGAVQRALLQLEDAGGNIFFGEPDIDISDWMSCDESGRGYINIFHCAKLYRSPLLYSTFMLWLLAELFEELPEVGDLEKPKLVFFFDEAHLLFNDAPKALRDNIEQVVKLIRSKGVGVYFITQQPSDIPDPILAQLGNRVQHALRAYTPAEQKAIKAAAQTFRVNPEFDTEETIMALGTGEAVVSFLDEKGRPGIAQRVTVLPPQSMMGAIDDERREAEIHADDLYGKYDVAVDNESAYEMINAKKIEQNRIEEEQRAKEEEAKRLEQEEKERIKAEKEREKELAREEKEREKERKEREKAQKEKEKKKAARKKNSALGKAANTAANTVGREIGKSIVRGILGIFKKK